MENAQPCSISQQFSPLELDQFQRDGYLIVRNLAGGLGLVVIALVAAAAVFLKITDRSTGSRSQIGCDTTVANIPRSSVRFDGAAVISPRGPKAVSNPDRACNLTGVI